MKLHKLFQKSPSKVVGVLKRIWERVHKSPRKRGYMQKYWDESDQEIGKLLYTIGKQKGNKIQKKAENAVTKLKNKYKSLHETYKQIDCAWT